MNALSDIKSKIEKNKEEKRERLLANILLYLGNDYTILLGIGEWNELWQWHII